MLLWARLITDSDRGERNEPDHLKLKQIRRCSTETNEEGVDQAYRRPIKERQGRIMRGRWWVMRRRRADKSIFAYSSIQRWQGERHCYQVNWNILTMCSKSKEWQEEDGKKKKERKKEPESQRWSAAQHCSAIKSGGGNMDISHTYEQWWSIPCSDVHTQRRETVQRETRWFKILTHTCTRTPACAHTNSQWLMRLGC